MHEIQKNDIKSALVAILNPARLLGVGLASYVGWLFWGFGGFFFYVAIVLWAVALAIFSVETIKDFKRRRFKNKRHSELWKAIQNRKHRFRQAIKRAPQHLGGSLTELPKSIDATQKHLYNLLRKADIVLYEITKSEGEAGLLTLPFGVLTSDPQTTELYTLADKNVADYKRHYEALIARVTRTEAQCALFISVLDDLRVQLLGHRLATPEAIPTQSEFINKMKEMQWQLDAIDKALDELDLPVAITTQNSPNAQNEATQRDVST